ncbi:hypothetical protein [Nonomuraea jabiensis]|uniref:hypothetical protein n=1 Tax=Nonomuraea jabiensis TaxID=882448 RepID=UPI003D712481
MTTAANGTFTITDTPPEAGDTTYTAAWEGNTNYNGSTGTVNKPPRCVPSRKRGRTPSASPT